MMIGICTLCGKFGKVHGHHLSQGRVIIVCGHCHSGLHRQMKVELPEEISNKLTFMALEKLGHSSRGYGYYATIQQLKSRELSEAEREFLHEAEGLYKE